MLLKPRRNRTVAEVIDLGPTRHGEPVTNKGMVESSAMPFSLTVSFSSIRPAASAQSFHFNIAAGNCRPLPWAVDTSIATGRKPPRVDVRWRGQDHEARTGSLWRQTLPKKDWGCESQDGNVCGLLRNGEPRLPQQPDGSNRNMATSSKSRRNSSAVQTPLETYLREINETALLNAAEEKELAVRIGQGDSRARDRMVRANLRLVVNIARGYSGKGLSLQDLIEEGNLGLLRAVEGFDPAMGTRFSTYASYWIKQSIKRALINTGKTIRIPAYMVELLSKWRRATARLTEELDRSPTPEEIARVLGLPKKKLPIIKKAIKIYNATPQTDQAEAGWTLGEMVMDERQLSPDDTLVESDSLRHVMEMLTTMDEREATVLKMRFGLDNHEPRTLKEIGEQLGLTRERVRQIETEALNRMADSLEDGRDRPSLRH
jgi:RNA polymerase primary sigma factor